MVFTEGDLQSRFIHALRSQASNKSQDFVTGYPPCPYGHQGRIFPNFEQLVTHVKGEHPSELQGLNERQVKTMIREKAVQAREIAPAKALAQDQMLVPDISGLSLIADTERPSSGKKRAAEFEPRARSGKMPTPIEVAIPSCSTNSLKQQESRRRPHEARLYDPRRGNNGQTSARRSVAETKNASSYEASPTVSHQPGQPTNYRQPELIELQRCDPRYPGLLLQPDSRPLSQEQLASEVKSIYAGLTMVETKCIHVDRAEAAANMAPDHWQALIALHRTLLHEHHDFFLASQHPSATPALRRLASKYVMPARMWKHGIHSFLELLRRRLPESLDYMLAFIYLAYQMMAVLYEILPEFQNTWVQCLGDLGRYRMAIEDEDIRDHETRASVACSWYAAADRKTSVTRKYHRLAILARPKALQHMYYYTTSLHCVEPLPTARQLITTLIRPFLGDKDNPSAITHGLLMPSDGAGGLRTRSEYGGTSPRWSSPTSWLSRHLDNGLSRLGNVLKNALSRISHATGLLNFISWTLVIRRAAATTVFQSPVSGLGSFIKDETPFDYLADALLLLGLIGALILYLRGPPEWNDRVRKLSLAIMCAMALLWTALVSMSFAPGIYLTVIKLWFASAFHFVGLDCALAHNTKAHLSRFMIILVMFVTIGVLMQDSETPRLVTALPLALALAAWLNWALPPFHVIFKWLTDTFDWTPPQNRSSHPPGVDLELGTVSEGEALLRSARPEDDPNASTNCQQPTAVSTPIQTRRRDPVPRHDTVPSRVDDDNGRAVRGFNSLPDPDDFSIGGSSDLDSLRSERRNH